MYQTFWRQVFRRTTRWGEASPALFWKSKKVLWFCRKGPDCIHLCVKFSIQNVVLRVSRRKNSKFFSCGAFFSCVFDEVPKFHETSCALKNFWLRARYYQKGEGNKRFRLIKTLKPVPTIFDPKNPNFQNSSACQVTSPVSIPKNHQENACTKNIQYQSFIADDVIKNFSDINKGFCPSGYSYQQYDDQVVFLYLINNHMLIPEVTGCIQVDSEFL